MALVALGKFEKTLRPSHNPLLPMRYFDQVVTWVDSDERHLAEVNCPNPAFQVRLSLMTHQTNCTKYPTESNALQEGHSFFSGNVYGADVMSSTVCTALRLDVTSLPGDCVFQVRYHETLA